MIPQEFRVGMGIAGFVVVIATCFLSGFLYLKTTVRFEDRRLEAAIRKAISLPTGRISTREAAEWVRLELNDQNFQSLDGLEHFVTLEHLNFSNSQVRDISALSKLTALKHLDLSNNLISDISALRELGALQTVDLSNNLIGNIEPLSNLPKLQVLSMNFNPDLWDLSHGNRFATFLGVRGCKVQNLQAMSGFASLQYLDAGENSITSVAGLEHCPNLTTLYLDGNRILSIGELPVLSALATLVLDGNAIQRVDSLPSLPALEEFKLANNKITHLPDISHLTSLKRLSLDGNPLSPAICAGADYYRSLGLAVSTNTCPDLPAAPPVQAGGMPAWKRRQLEAIERDRNRALAPGFIPRVSTPTDLQRYYDPSGRYSPPSRQY